MGLQLGERACSSDNCALSSESEPACCLGADSRSPLSLDEWRHGAVVTCVNLGMDSDLAGQFLLHR
jgi:hypothetical protein